MPYVGKFFLNGRGPILLFEIYSLDYIPYVDYINILFFSTID